MNKIEMEINNNRTMQLAQQKYDGTITISMYNKTTSVVDHEMNISPADMTMLLNYYQYKKDRKEEIF